MQAEEFTTTSEESYTAPAVTAVTPVGDILIGTGNGGWGSYTIYN